MFVFLQNVVILNIGIGLDISDLILFLTTKLIIVPCWIAQQIWESTFFWITKFLGSKIFGIEKVGVNIFGRSIYFGLRFLFLGGCDGANSFWGFKIWPPNWIFHKMASCHIKGHPNTKYTRRRLKEVSKEISSVALLSQACILFKTNLI